MKKFRKFWVVICELLGCWAAGRGNTKPDPQWRAHRKYDTGVLLGMKMPGLNGSRIVCITWFIKLRSAQTQEDRIFRDTWNLSGASDLDQLRSLLVHLQLILSQDKVLEIKLEPIAWKMSQDIQRKTPVLMSLENGFKAARRDLNCKKLLKSSSPVVNGRI